MQRARTRLTGWLALLTVLFYGLAPALASLVYHPVVPVACLTSQVHTCSCRPDPHAVEACCCAHPHSDADGDAGGCRVGKLPCDGGPAPEGAFWTTGHPLPLPPVSAAVAPHQPYRLTYPRLSFQTVTCCLDLPCPPPRLPATS